MLHGVDDRRWPGLLEGLALGAVIAVARAGELVARAVLVPLFALSFVWALVREALRRGGERA